MNSRRLIGGRVIGILKLFHLGCFTLFKSLGKVISAQTGLWSDNGFFNSIIPPSLVLALDPVL